MNTAAPDPSAPSDAAIALLEIVSSGVKVGISDTVLLSAIDSAFSRLLARQLQAAGGEGAAAAVGGALEYEDFEKVRLFEFDTPENMIALFKQHMTGLNYGDEETADAKSHFIHGYCAFRRQLQLHDLATPAAPVGGFVVVPVRLPALAVSEIKDWLEAEYQLYDAKARPFWAGLLKIITGLSIEQQITINENRATAAQPSAKDGVRVEPEPYTNMYGNFSGQQYELLNGRQARVTYDRGRKVSAYYSNSCFWKEEDTKAFSDAVTATGAASYANFHYPPDEADYMQSPAALASWMLVHHRAKFTTPEYAAIYQMLKDLADSREATTASGLVDDAMVERAFDAYQRVWDQHEKRIDDKPLPIRKLVRAALEAALDREVGRDV